MEKQQILIIDDDPNIRKTLSDILKVKGYEPLNARNGREGLELLKQSSANLIIIDLGLPDMPGLEVLDRVKAAHPSAEVIILTGNASLDSAIEATNKGAFSYLLKPYEIDQMMLHVRRAVEKHEAEAKIVRRTVELEKVNAQLSEKNRELANEIAERERAEERLRKEVGLKNFLLDLYEKAPALKDKELYDYALDEVVRLSDSAIGFFHLVSDDQKDVILTTWNREALNNCTAAYAAHYSIDQAGNWVDCVRLKRPVVYNDFPCSPNQKGLPEGHTPVWRFMSVPVIEGDKVRIIFGVGNKSAEYDMYDAVMIQVVANDLQRIIGERRAEEALKRSEAYFRSLIENSSDVITILNEDGSIRYISPSVERVAGIKPTDMTGRNVFEYVHPDDVSVARGIFNHAVQTPGVTLSAEFRLWHNDSSWHIYETATQNLLENDAVKGIVANSHDITARRQAEEKIQASLREKEILLKEIHHRVKNNLQVVSSLLNLQSGFLKDGESLDIFKESQSRVNTIALVHTKLYQSENLSEIDSAGFIEDLAGSLLQALGKGTEAVKIRTDIHDVYLNIDQAIPCGLIVNELITNTLKHAFPGGREGKITITMRSDGERIVVRFQDNGVGFPPAFDFRNTQSLGLQLVNILVAQLRGTIELVADGGAAFIITFPIRDKQE